MVFVRHAEQSAREIEKARAPWAIGLAQLTRSGIATLGTAPTEAAAHLDAAEATFERGDSLARVPATEV